MTRREAKDFIEAIKNMRDNVNDRIASMCVAVFPTQREYDGSLIKAGTRYAKGGKIYKAAVDLWNTEENSIANAPTLWEELQYINGVRVIPETITVTTMFDKDELGYWNGQIYKSLVDNNVYTPEQYAPNWELQG